MTGPPGPYAVEWPAPAKRALQRLPEEVAVVAVEFTYGPLADSRLRVGRALRFGLEGPHSAHRGDYRVLYAIDEANRRVVILAIDHRADVYRPR